MEISRSADTLEISQDMYVSKLLEKFGMSNCKPISTPIDTTYRDDIDDNPEQFDTTVYRQLIGGLLYVSLISRPDIAFAVNYLSQFCSKPERRDFIAAKRVLRFLKGNKQKLIYKKSEINVVAYTDADWAADKNTRRSTSGFLIKSTNDESPIL